MPTISVITPTFHREEQLARCVESVLSQDVDAVIEHLVVNDYGRPLGRADWMDDPRVRVLDTYRTERSFARNTGAALSRGDWLYFLDDDDYALPGAFAAMLDVAERTKAAHIYGGYRILVETEQQRHTLTPMLPCEIFPRLVAGETLPPQASWLRRDAFFDIGGFDPMAVPVEDVDLFRRVSLIGTAAGTQAVVAEVLVEHPATTTTREDIKRVRWDQSMERCLSRPEAMRLLLRQTEADVYWRGRCARVYFGSAVRNLRQSRYVVALSRLTAALRLSRSPRAECGAFQRGLRRKQDEVLKKQVV